LEEVIRVVKTAQRVSVVAAAVVAAIGLAAAPASAHDNSALFGPWYRTAGQVKVLWNGSEHNRIEICDFWPNGVSVSAQFYWRKPGMVGEQFGQISDANGSASGCGIWTAPSSGYIVSYKGYQGTDEYSTGWIAVD
jgi:hypothetical protein